MMFLNKEIVCCSFAPRLHTKSHFLFVCFCRSQRHKWKCDLTQLYEIELLVVDYNSGQRTEKDQCISSKCRKHFGWCFFWRCCWFQSPALLLFSINILLRLSASCFHQQSCHSLLLCLSLSFSPLLTSCSSSSSYSHTANRADEQQKVQFRKSHIRRSIRVKTMKIQF